MFISPPRPFLYQFLRWRRNNIRTDWAASGINVRSEHSPSRKLHRGSNESRGFQIGRWIYKLLGLDSGSQPEECVHHPQPQRGMQSRTALLRKREVSDQPNRVLARSLSQFGNNQFEFFTLKAIKKEMCNEKIVRIPRRPVANVLMEKLNMRQ